MTLFDTHAHYIDSRFEEEYEGGAAALIPEVFASGVSYIITVGTRPENSERAIEQAKKYQGMFAAVGIHPTDLFGLSGTPEQEIAKIRAMIENRAENKIVAIGDGCEIALVQYSDKIEISPNAKVGSVEKIGF